MVFGTEYAELDISYYITAFEFLSSVFAILAIVYWRWRTSVTVGRVSEGLPVFIVQKPLQILSTVAPTVIYDFAQVTWTPNVQKLTTTKTEKI